MKLDAIRMAIRDAEDFTHPSVITEALAQLEVAERGYNGTLIALGVLTELCKQKDKALHQCHSRTLIASSDPNGAGAEDVALIEIRRICQAALTLQTEEAG